MKVVIRFCYKMAMFTPRSRVTGLESDKVEQESEPTPQTLSDGVLVVGISSKGPRDFFGGTSKIRQRERCLLNAKNCVPKSLLHGVGEVKIGSRREMHRTFIGHACSIATKCLQTG